METCVTQEGILGMYMLLYSTVSVDVITYPCPRYMLLTHKSSYILNLVEKGGGLIEANAKGMAHSVYTILNSTLCINVSFIVYHDPVVVASLALQVLITRKYTTLMTVFVNKN